MSAAPVRSDERALRPDPRLVLQWADQACMWLDQLGRVPRRSHQALRARRSVELTLIHIGDVLGVDRDSVIVAAVMREAEQARAHARETGTRQWYLEDA